MERILRRLGIRGTRDLRILAAFLLAGYLLGGVAYLVDPLPEVRVILLLLVLFPPIYIVGALYANAVIWACNRGTVPRRLAACTCLWMAVLSLSFGVSRLFPRFQAYWVVDWILIGIFVCTVMIHYVFENAFAKPDKTARTRFLFCYILLGAVFFFLLRLPLGDGYTLASYPARVHFYLLGGSGLTLIFGLVFFLLELNRLLSRLIGKIK